MNVLPLLTDSLPDWNKEQLLAYADELVATRTEDGFDNVLLVAQAAKLEVVAARIKERAKLAAITDVRAYGRGGVMKMGVTLTVKETGVVYDYSGDPVWQRLQGDCSTANARRKEREELLKKLPYGGMMLTDEDTGELYRAYPPAKSGSDGVIVSIQ